MRLRVPSVAFHAEFYFAKLLEHYWVAAITRYARLVALPSPIHPLQFVGQLLVREGVLKTSQWSFK
jgi:hypothetical protein